MRVLVMAHNVCSRILYCQPRINKPCAVSFVANDISLWVGTPSLKQPIACQCIHMISTLNSPDIHIPLYRMNHSHDIPHDIFYIFLSFKNSNSRDSCHCLPHIMVNPSFHRDKRPAIFLPHRWDAVHRPGKRQWARAPSETRPGLPGQQGSGGRGLV